ncbi:MAG: hypothetical protein ACOC0N_01895 [Chroococcales cyanobacterium]
MILPLYPLLLLATALGSIFLHHRTSNEIYRVLAACTTIVCLIWGFAIAHWSIHLLCLVLLFKFNRVALVKIVSSNW